MLNLLTFLLLLAGSIYLLIRLRRVKKKNENQPKYKANLLSDDDYRIVRLLSKGGNPEEKDKDLLLAKIAIQLDYNNDYISLEQAMDKIQLLLSQEFVNEQKNELLKN